MRLEYDPRGRLIPPIRTTVLVPTLRRSLLARLTAPPRAYGWCRTRWRGATLALTLQTRRGVNVSAATRRRWLHALGWVWKRATLAASDDAPQRGDRLARIRYAFQPLKPWEAMVFADELDIHLVPNVGGAWMPKGPQLEVMTPGQNQQHDLAGALELTPGTLHHGLSPRTTHALVRDRLPVLEARYPAERYPRLSVVVDHDKIPQATAAEPWLAAHPRFARRFWPTYGPRAHPIERAFGDVHDGCTRHHQRQRLPDLVPDGGEHLQLNGPWKYHLSARYDDPAVTAAVEKITAEEQVNAAA